MLFPVLSYHYRGKHPQPNRRKSHDSSQGSSRIGLALGVGVARSAGAGTASAEGAGSDNTTANGGTATGSNPSASDTMGFGVVNHMQGDGTRVGFDGLAGGDYNDDNGIG